jgi:hypothetical protein
MVMNRQIKLVALLFFLVPMLGGCAGFGKGVVQGLLDDAEEKDNRSCQIWSKGFDGIGAAMEQTEGKAKVLMIHGVGHHIPGYSTILLENLAKELDLTVMESPFKELTLGDLDDPSKDLGNLRLNRLISKDRSRELLFYELTWSSISKPEKEVLEYDNSGEYSFRRAKVNNILKAFSNDAIADPMIYLGEKQEDIQKSVSQSYCWMISNDWNDFPSGIHKGCDLSGPGRFVNAEKDDFIFISHSLGSRITIDSFQRVAAQLNKKEFQEKFPDIKKLQSVVQQKEVTIFMLSNQLPLLQLGRSLPEVLGEQEKYCSPKGSNFAERFSSQTHIVAFSDPNDLLSYAIPPGFKDKYLDSRMCPKVSNININVAHVVDVFGVSNVANPMEAHVGYDNDERVVALIAHGLSNENSAPIINSNCEWTELTN